MLSSLDKTTIIMAAIGAIFTILSVGYGLIWVIDKIIRGC